MKMMDFDEKMMLKALSLARKGLGRVSPNPMVGAVVTKRGLVVSSGYHKMYGGHHAEVDALSKIKHRGQGATLYVNLEPCCHHGKTPPCADAIVRSGIKRVVVGTVDPNPLVKGKGISLLRSKGIEVTVGVSEHECRSLNEGYFKHISTGLPFVLVKVALTLDGKIALESGESKWITSKKARSFAHELRSCVDAVLVGANTVIEDDPVLNTRLAKGARRNPIRVILDSGLRTRPGSKVYDCSKGSKTYIFTGSRALKRKVSLFEKRGVEVINTKDSRDGVDLKSVISELGKRRVTSLLVEGGCEVFSGFVKEKLADKLLLVYGNKIVGGKNSVSPFSQIRVSKLNQAFTLKHLSAINLGLDIVITGYLK